MHLFLVELIIAAAYTGI